MSPSELAETLKNIPQIVWGIGIFATTLVVCAVFTAPTKARVEKREKPGE